jgi:hypothetical protein
MRGLRQLRDVVGGILEREELATDLSIVRAVRFSRRAAFSCETEVEQHPKREEEPHNRNSEPPAILLCHESPRSSLPQIGTGMIALWFRENCAVQHVPSDKGPARRRRDQDRDAPCGCTGYLCFR